jgi:hypothetical protein
MTISESFVDRLREAFVDSSEADIEMLRAAANSASTNLGANRAIALVRIAYGESASLEEKADLRNRLNADGEVIPSQGHDHLVRVLAGESLIILFGRLKYNRGLLAALAARCAKHLGWRPVHPDIDTQAASYLKFRGVQNRQHSAAGLTLVGDASAEDQPWTGTEAKLKNLHSQLKGIQFVAEEREELSWWIASSFRPPTALSVAAEFNNCLRYYPEPFATDELLKTKLNGSAGEKQWILEVPSPGKEISDLCPALSGESDATVPKEALLLEEVRCVLDQIMLAQTYAGAQEK